ncbi:MAG: hypothetical protein V5A45_08790 [Haloarculaceae archaeon]
MGKYDWCRSAVGLDTIRDGGDSLVLGAGERLREGGVDISETDDAIEVSDSDGIGVRISRA